ncbi:hypothetical protein AX17_007306 [Amanita inopinata Kibby_2008]|nr:hypothetical protein AX17_007306 [Amanita inopinata Kibby_2008]
MAYMNNQFPQYQQDIVSGEQYRYALTNFRIAHEKVEQQRHQLEEQERQVAQLRARIALLEGVPDSQRLSKSGNSVDDFSIKNAASQLDKQINRWAAEVVGEAQVPLEGIRKAALAGIAGGMELDAYTSPVSSLQAQSYLRHAMSEAISDGVINCLIVTNSTEANIQLTRIHEHLFSRDPTVAGVWRRQTFSAAVESVTPDMSLNILHEQVPELMAVLQGRLPSASGTSLLDSAYDFSRMLHASTANSGDIFYRAFVPEVGSTLYPRQIELVKRCVRSERGEIDRVGATLFPGLAKVSRGAANTDNIQTVVRRAQVICECALAGRPIMPLNGMPETHTP